MTKLCKSCNISYLNLSKGHLSDSNCRLCHIIQKISQDKKYACFYMNELLICESDLDQNYIISFYVKYIMTYKKIPSPYEIDKNVKISNTPLYNFAKNSSHKIFLTNLFNFSYVTKNDCTDPNIVNKNNFIIHTHFINHNKNILDIASCSILDQIETISLSSDKLSLQIIETELAYSLIGNKLV